MSRITGTNAKEMMEAYNAVYAPQELTEEQVWEEVENWVNSLLEEGYDLSDYTWEEMYDAYIEENTGQKIGAGIRDVIGSNWRGLTGRQTSSTNPLSRATNAVGRAVSAPVRAGINYTGAVMQGYAGQKTTSKNPISQAANAVTRNVSGVVKGLATGNPGNPKKPSYTQSSERQGPYVPSRLKSAVTAAPAPKGSGSPVVGAGPGLKSAVTAAPAPKSTPFTKVAPAKPSGPATGKLGSTSFERRTPTSAELKAAQAARAGGEKSPEKVLQAAKAASAPSPARNGFGVSATPIAAKASVSTATAPEVKATNTAAAKTTSTPVAPKAPMAGRDQMLQRNLKNGMEYDAYDLVLEYLLSQGHVDTVEEAHYVMLEMDAETIEKIVEETK